MLISVFVPHARTLLHVIAAPVGLAALAMIFVLRESVGTALLGMGYFGLWLLYYWLAAWSEGQAVLKR